MPLFNVTLSYSGTKTVQVFAEDEETAEDEAIDLIDDFEPDDWDEWDFEEVSHIEIEEE